MDNFKERFSPTTTSIGSASYLVLELNADEKIEQFQVEMIANNEISGILPIDIRQRDNLINLYYNVTSKQPLSLIFSRKRFSRNEFISFLYNVVSVIDDCKNYLLSNDRFLLDENYIYIDPSTLETSLVYLPIQGENDTSKNIKDFINRLIIETANLDDKQTDNYLQRIINYLRNDIINLVDFKMFLNELKGNRIESKPAPIQQPIKEQLAQNINIPIQEVRTPVEEISESRKPQNINIPNIDTPKLNIPRSNQNIPSGKNNEKKGKSSTPKKEKNSKDKKSKEKVEQRSGETKMGYKSSTIFIAIVSQVIILGIIISFWDALNNSGNDLLTTLAGIAIVVGGLDYFLFKKLLNKENMIAKSVKTTTVKSNNKDKSQKAPNRPQQRPVDMNKREVRNVEQPEHYNEPVVHRQVDYDEQTTAIDSYNVDETTFIGDEIVQKRAFLQGTKNGIMEEVNITKDSFIIGRIREQVDYVTDNNTIGKMHAEIITRDGHYYLKDLNSRNGTYLNNERLVGNQEYHLNNNDKVIFSNSNFTFIILE